ncbi:unnamed protein product [Dicrocoelium dendriticum]|nr:unnamed protein product [Dicrocoelium dendriticum]
MSFSNCLQQLDKTSLYMHILKIIRRTSPMLIQPQCLVVTALISGRNFPERLSHYLVCEARFNNEMLSTDPVPHSIQPQLEQELAWQLDRSSLRQHRLQRTALKMQFFAVHSQSPLKEPVGFIMLDLRSCSFQKVYRWYRLLHSKYKRAPEVYCGIYLDGVDDASFSGPKVMTGFGTAISLTDLVPHPIPEVDEHPTVVKHLSDRIPVRYAIGPRCLAKDDFVLTLKFKEITGLASLIPLDHELSPENQSGFYFSFNLLGSTASLSKRFDTLTQTNFLSEEHTFFLRSTIDVLRAYFSHISPLKVQLCYGNRCLAEALVPIEQMLHTNAYSSDGFATLEDSFELVPTDAPTNLDNQTVFHHDDRPRVSLRLTLKPTMTSKSYLPVEEMNSCCLSLVQKPSMRTESSHEIIADMICQRDNSPVHKNEPANFVQLNTDNHISLPVDSSTNACGTEQQHTEQNLELRHYCYTVELRSIKTSHHFGQDPMVYAKYIFPLFGSRSPVMTMPPVPLKRNREVTLPEGYCAFEFAALYDELNQRLSVTPLIVELFNRQRSVKGSDELLARAVIHPDIVLSSPLRNECGTTVRRYYGTCDLILARTLSETDLRNPQGDRGKQVGQLNFGLVLEDYGHHVTSTSTVPSRGEEADLGDLKPSVSKTDIRSTAEYQTAFELELWRATEETKFQTRLKQREQQLMAAFAEEWHKRDSERELLCRKKLSEYRSLEEKLRATLAELAARECQLAAGEAELVRLRQDILSEAELQRKQLAQQSEVQVRDLESQLKLERRQSAHWKTKADELQSRCAELENQLCELQGKVAQMQFTKTSPPSLKQPNTEVSVDVQLKIAQLTTEIVRIRETLTETERRLETAEKGRVRYRQLCARALHEINRLKQEAEMNTRQSLAKREAELEHLRARYLNLEDRELTTRIRNWNGGSPIRNGDVATRTSTANERADCVVFDHARMDISNNFNTQGPTQTSSASEIARLIAERDSLLNTGVYDDDDPIILNLEKQMQRLKECDAC